MIVIKNYTTNETIKLEKKYFPAGEQHVNLYGFAHKLDRCGITMFYEDDRDIFQFMLVINALINIDCHILDTNIPYLPYSRQDRVCAEGDPFSLEIILQQLKSITGMFNVLDVHSNVSLTPNINEIDQKFIWSSFFKSFSETHVLVSPDKGAKHKTLRMSKVHNMLVLGFDKVRDPKSGKLSGFKAQGNVLPMPYIIVDDICDGGGTFNGIAKILKDGGATEVILCVTHGIFSKGVEALELIDKVYCTRSLAKHNSGTQSPLEIIKVKG